MTDQNDSLPELPEREQRIAQGIAMVAAGTPWRRAASETGIPMGTLGDRIRWLRSGGPEREDRLRKAEDQLLDLAFIAADAAAAELARRVVEDPQSIPNKELIPIASMSRDTVNLRRGWTRGNGDASTHGVGSLAAKLQDIGGAGSKVTLTVEPADRCIDVTGRRVDLESD